MNSYPSLRLLCLALAMAGNSLGEKEAHWSLQELTSGAWMDCFVKVGSKICVRQSFAAVSETGELV